MWRFGCLFGFSWKIYLLAISGRAQEAQEKPRRSPGGAQESPGTAPGMTTKFVIFDRCFLRVWCPKRTPGAQVLKKVFINPWKIRIFCTSFISREISRFSFFLWWVRLSLEHSMFHFYIFVLFGIALLCFAVKFWLERSSCMLFPL